uniref:Bm8001 n=1 Tax=Brugia malayi TaxID=6279 RepID=A0A0I9N3L6_BRUMA|nr:Bm8001 [Brugia malayi]
MRAGVLQFDSIAMQDMIQDDQMMRCVTYPTQQIVAENMLNNLPPYIDEAIKNERSTLALMSCNALYFLLSRDAQRTRQNQREYEDAACQRFQVIMRWIYFHQQNYDYYNSLKRDPNAQPVTFPRIVQLFSCVHFEHMRPEIRRYFATYIRGLSNTMFANAARSYLPELQ